MSLFMNPVFLRLTIILLSLLYVQHNRWRLSTVNSDYSVCPSYPPAVIVPKDTDDDMLKKVAKFRQGGRFPVLSYYHRKNGVVSCFSSSPPPVFTSHAHKQTNKNNSSSQTHYFSGNPTQQSAADGRQQEALRRRRAPPPGCHWRLRQGLHYWHALQSAGAAGTDGGWRVWIQVIL